jgi:hypothetical protein
LEPESVQLPASPPHVLAVKAQLWPELHTHDAPPQVGLGAELEPPQRMADGAMRQRLGRAAVIPWIRS